MTDVWVSDAWVVVLSGEPLSDTIDARQAIDYERSVPLAGYARRTSAPDSKFVAGWVFAG